jgi:mono/diheme cytochrome c family protein
MQSLTMTVLIFLLASPALAQQPPPAPEPPPTLAPVLVEGPRIFPERTPTTEHAREEIQSTVPGGAEVVGEKTIQESLGANLRNVLDFVPGVLVRPRFGLADESRPAATSWAPGTRSNFPSPRRSSSGWEEGGKMKSMGRILLIPLAVASAAVLTLSAVAAQTKPASRRAHSSRGAEPHGDPKGWKFKLPGGGDPGRGRAAFEKFECYTCHEIKGEKFPAPTKQDAIGPDLTAVGQHHSVGFLAESIMNPSALIDPGQEFAAHDGTSKMPSFNDSMTVQELVDLVAYLKGLGPPARPAGTGHRH